MMKVETRVKVTEQILDLLKQHPDLTLAEVAKNTGKSVSTIERLVAKLRKEGRLKRVGPTKGGRWEVIV